MISAPPRKQPRLGLWPETMVPSMRARANTDLLWFCRHVLGFNLLEDEPHGALCRWLQKPAPAGKRLVLMPRSSFKTTIISIGYMLWRLLKDPDERQLLDSDLRANAKKLLSVQRRHLESNARLRQLYGDLTTETGWTEEQFTVARDRVSKEPSVMTSGMDQVVVMLHFDCICADDLVNNTNIISKDSLEKTAEHIRLLNPLLDPPEISPNREINVLGTRWDDQDAYAGILRSTGLDGETLEAELDQGECQIGEWSVFFRSAYRRIEGKTTHYLADEGEGLFSLFTPKFLEDQRSNANLGAYWFAANYLNNPVPSGDATFQRDWFKYWTPPLPEVDLDVLMTVDPALSESKHGDSSGIIVGGVTPSMDIYLFEAWKAHVSLRDLIRQIYLIFKVYRPRVVGVETVGFQRSLKYMLDDLAAEEGEWLPIRELKPDTNETKEMRIRSLQPLYENGKVWHKRSMGMLEHELLKWRFARKRQPDDLADALAYLRIMATPRTGHRKGTPPSPENPTTGY